MAIEVSSECMARLRQELSNATTLAKSRRAYSRVCDVLRDMSQEQIKELLQIIAQCLPEQEDLLFDVSAVLRGQLHPDSLVERIIRQLREATTEADFQLVSMNVGRVIAARPNSQALRPLRNWLDTIASKKEHPFSGYCQALAEMVSAACGAISEMEEEDKRWVRAQKEPWRTIILWFFEKNKASHSKQYPNGETDPEVEVTFQELKQFGVLEPWFSPEGAEGPAYFHLTNIGREYAKRLKVKDRQPPS